MVLKFIDENETRYLKTIFYGIDGSGKSTAAKVYCESRGLKPAVIDFDYTNHTGLPRLECDWSTSREVISGVVEIIHDIEKDPNFDTLIIDGVGTLNELLLPKTQGKDPRRTYLIRTQNFKKIWKALLHAKIHFIFIGQKDMIVTEDNESSKFAELINNMVDYKFHCIHSGKGFGSKDFTHICTKTRGEIEPLIGSPINVPEDLPFQDEPVPAPIRMQREPIIKEKSSIPKNDFVTANEIPAEDFVDDPVRNQCILIKEQLEKDGIEVTKSSMRNRVVKLIKEGTLPKANRPFLIQYIDKHCPEGLE